MRTFAFLFALATVLYHRWSWFELAPTAIPLASAVLVLLRPSSRWRFLLFAVLQTGWAYHDLPGANTNRTLQVFLTASIVCGWIVAAVRARALPTSEQWLRAFEPALRLQLVAIYFWAFWHKLNVDFFDLEKSCGVDLYRRVTLRVPWIPWPTAEWAMAAVVYGTVVVEGLLLALLVPRRTRNVALVLGVALHFGCGLTMFYDFSMTMLALLFLFAPPGLALALAQTPAFDLRARLRLGEKQWTWLVTAIAAVLCVATELVFTNMYNAFALAWWLLPIPLFVVARTIYTKGLEQRPAGDSLRVAPVMALFPALVLLDGACPYIGLKTETSIAMYSNLRTEGGETNHLLVSKPLDLFDYQTDLVQMVSSSDPQLADLAREGNRVPFYVVRKRVWEAASRGTRGIQVAFVRDGCTVELAAAEEDPEVGRAPSYLERKLLRFRTILPGDANVCSH